LKAKAPLEPQALPESPLNRDRFANDLTDFAKRMNDRGVIVYFFMPDLLVRESDMAAWSLLQRDLTSRVEQLGGKWLTQRSQDIYFVDSSQFCDSPFHPIQTQALIKSELLARQLSRRK
jgi:hypothetical protein